MTYFPKEQSGLGMVLFAALVVALMLFMPSLVIVLRPEKWWMALVFPHTFIGVPMSTWLLINVIRSFRHHFPPEHQRESLPKAVEPGRWMDE